LVLLISEDDISSLLDMPAAVEQMAGAFGELARGRALTPNRFTVSVPQSHGTFRLMPSVLLDSKASGFKLLAGTAGQRRPGRSYFLVTLLDYEDGSIQCIMSASRLTQIRTGAVSALATKHLARRSSRSFGLVGAGLQGQGQLDAICSTLRPSQVLIYDHSRQKASLMADRATTAFGVDARAVDRVDEALAADVVSTATTSTSPMMNASNVAPGTHINAIGSNTPARKEIDPGLLEISRVIVDLREQAVQESGDLEPIRKGELPMGTIYGELAEIVTGSKPGRTSETEITIFKSVGIALQDIALAKLLYERALARGVGRNIELQ
jgi:ornithine cyclodeaminase/alanine dehydrogenase-like protein (mu-crystallin family)